MADYRNTDGLVLKIFLDVNALTDVMLKTWVIWYMVHMFTIIDYLI